MSRSESHGQKLATTAVRPRDREARRQAILDVARDVFLEDGYAAASMSAIAAKVGGSKATLYNYFSSKEDLFTAVVQTHCARMQSILYDGAQPGGDVVSELQRFGGRYAHTLLSDPVLALHRPIVAECARFPEIGRVLYEAGPRPSLARLAGYIDKAMADGKLRRADAACAAEQFTDLCLSGLYRARLWNVAPRPSDAQVAANVDAALTTFMAAYGVAAAART